MIQNGVDGDKGVMNEARTRLLPISPILAIPIAF